MDKVHKHNSFNLIGDLVGPRTVPDTVVKRKIPSLPRESNPRTLFVY
jgi:hypothetical protein